MCMSAASVRGSGLVLRYNASNSGSAMLVPLQVSKAIRVSDFNASDFWTSRNVVRRSRLGFPTSSL